MKFIHEWIIEVKISFILDVGYAHIVWNARFVFNHAIYAHQSMVNEGNIVRYCDRLRKRTALTKRD